MTSKDDVRILGMPVSQISPPAEQKKKRKKFPRGPFPEAIDAPRSAPDPARYQLVPMAVDSLSAMVLEIDFVFGSRRWAHRPRRPPPRYRKPGLVDTEP